MRMSVLRLAPACDMASAAVRAMGSSLASCVDVLERLVVTRNGGAKFLQPVKTSIMAPASAMSVRWFEGRNRVLRIKLALAPEEASDHAENADERQRGLEDPCRLQPSGGGMRERLYSDHVYLSPFASCVSCSVIVIAAQGQEEHLAPC